MDPFVFVAVLIAAACHAGWNAILKLNVEPVIATTLVAAASGLVVVPFAFFAGPLNIAAWPYLVASVVVHIGYYLTLAEAYRYGDLGQVYRSRGGRRPCARRCSLRLSSVKCRGCSDGPACLR